MVFSCLTVNPNQPQPLKCIKQTASNSFEVMPLSMQCIKLSPITAQEFSSQSACANCLNTDNHLKIKNHWCHLRSKQKLQYSVGSYKGKVLLSRPLGFRCRRLLLVMCTSGKYLRRKPIGEKYQECPT
ncbi:hypothetical protein PGT21_018683 [Puccinia graminis f. sp. tritici]|uniref:Uncharacterized protein n=1 Tax=Puccinia graminis f. sp. tritici TaxID=56615 RepID=A0A5B0NNU6_PUCGR|nr:hypothetical protein PGT21_018683 [Puccinia graminis f. sp. tritici]